MAFKYFGGRTPTVDAPWTCPSCGAENTQPLKAGCQTCGAGADARKVEAQPAGSPQGHVPLTPAGVPASSVAGAKAVRDWMTTRDMPLDQATPWANSEDIQEAFMAGVAWAQAQTPQVRPGDLVLPYDAVLFTGSSEEIAAKASADQRLLKDLPTTPLYLAFKDLPPQDRPEQDTREVGAETLATILAALAFYRDHQLGYGAIPGQLDADAVTALITRLTPEEAHS